MRKQFYCSPWGAGKTRELFDSCCETSGLGFIPEGMPGAGIYLNGFRLAQSERYDDGFRPFDCVEMADHSAKWFAVHWTWKTPDFRVLPFGFIPHVPPRWNWFGSQVIFSLEVVPNGHKN